MLETFFQSDPWVRLPFYAALGCVLELIFTATMDLIYPQFFCSWNTATYAVPSAQRPDWAPPGRDLRGRGYTFLWMLPVYALMALAEPLHLAILHWPWPLRGLSYLVVLWTIEFIAGWLLKKILGRCPWDYGYSRFSYQGFIRWDYAPIWFCFGFLFEYFHLRLLALTPYLKEVFF